ncbi:hypothetical protein A9Q75_05965 [Colwellia psychrerythraea]|uniref:Fucosyltransferase C-terminal domain-containing protein n=1 Tax=Colwellia psychrerythraea TaxID=28229 RepID=A0A1Y5EHN5_COLPS|nr:hypothetical protein A9Q75_05965 [Colwellia psychrerythraea]
MKKLSYVSTTFTNNECFEPKGVHNRDGFLDFIVELKVNLHKEGYDLSTEDINPVGSSSIAIHANLRPDFKRYLAKQNILIIFESEAIVKRNFNLDSHKYFDIIFTWNKSLVDNVKYFYINYSHNITDQEITGVTSIPPQKRKGKILISSNKHCAYKDELYTERLKIIDWYEKYDRKNSFHLYGTRWELVILKNWPFSNIINEFNRKYKFLTQNRSSYKGLVEFKSATYSQYKYAYCLENARGINGYITEKIFDAFRAGIVPIYIGNEDVNNSIPENCFINYDSFVSISTLDDYLEKVSDADYQKIQENIEIFLKSEKYYCFSSEYFSEKIVTGVINLSNCNKSSDNDSMNELS